ncbi:hypothetical protein [Jiangella mangrovi]|uniref:GNAT family N-acetyltransferase n=1 Tax=Jiangella mangrovi TaxID=1524084 RepID=A0A7W9GM72_9ACTN|nr:hypothetical protein [Jiangella mangrovi]MBB5786256.1 hypothetical protein [Jiangella mangrovi]
MGAPAVVVRPISDADTGAASRFLHQHLNQRVSAAAWGRLLAPPWKADAPNRGFQLLSDDGAVVGVYAAVYSDRDIAGERVPFCNLAAFCVLEEYRAHSLRLVRALLGQKGYVFTDLSPSGNVIALNERLGFQRLDTATRLVANLPRPQRGTRVTTAPAALDHVLTGRDAEIHRDHRQAPAAQHVLVERGGEHGYLVYRRDRRKRLPFFATPLYAGGDPGVLQAAWPAVSAHLLRQGLPLTLAERRVLGFTPGGPGVELAGPRPRMFRAKDVGAESIDHLYSELTLVRW